MAVLPDSGNINIASGVTFIQQPSLTWYINKQTNRIQGETDNLQAVQQAVEIILNVERFRWQIYSPNSGMQWDGLIGQNPGYVASEVQRRIRDALSVDERVLGISDFQYAMNGNAMTCSLTVNTVYGQTQNTVEVILN